MSRLFIIKQSHQFTASQSSNIQFFFSWISLQYSLSLQDHIYHVLENQKAPPFHKLDSPIPEQPPIYQEVSQITTSRAGESTNSSLPDEYACIN